MQKAFSAVPGGHRLNYLMQRFVTHSLPRQPDDLEGTLATAQRHLDAIMSTTSKPLADLTFFEFGAGYDLSEPLAAIAIGARNHICYDIKPIARPPMIRAAAMVLRDLGCDLPEPPPEDREIPGYLESIGLTYVAPADARASGLASASIDAVTTTSVLEHISKADLMLIMVELRRILTPGGVCSFAIDYHDHFARTDPGIDGLHFLRFEEQEWKRWNSDLQYQTRLRHDDYVELFEEAGFLLTSVDPVLDARFPADPPMASVFRGRTDLAIGDGWFVLTNPG